jgi:hypothetical protein
MRRVFTFLLVAFTAAAPASAGEVVLEFRDGLVTLTAREAPVRQILEEWSRLGNTRVVNADKVFSGPVTLELARVPEKQALEILLRAAPGYIAAPRADAGGPSQFARILVMPPSAAPPPRPASIRPPVRPPVFQQPTYTPPVLLDDQDQPVDPNMPGGQGVMQPDPNLPEDGMQGADPNAPGQPVPGPYPGVQPYPPAGDQPPPMPEQDGDGIPQQPQATPPGPIPGQGTAVVGRPGQVVTPGPNQQPRR